MKQFGPMLIVWGAAMATLLLTGELGTSLMFYGAFLALLYVATGRFSFPLIGLVLFALGAWFVAGHVAHVHARVLAWQHPFDPTLYNQPGGSYQLAQSLFAQADGGLLGTGFDQSLLQYPVELANHVVVRRSILPVPESDLIYAVITDELGLVGRRRPAARLPAVRRARPEDGDARAGLVLASCWPPACRSSWRCRCS